MASRIKGIAVEIGGDTSGLEKSLAAVNNSIKKTQSQLRDVNNLLKLDPSNTILLAQKQELLQSAIGDTEKKLEDNQICLRREIIKMLLAALPFLAVCVVGFAARNQTVCTIGLVLACAAVIFVGDLFVAPVVRYGKFLRDLFSGLTRKTAGTLVRVGEDDIYENGVIFHEMIVNIYEDMAPEGERRFLIEPAMPLDTALIGRDVAVTSHDKVVLAVELLGAKV